MTKKSNSADYTKGIKVIDPVIQSLLIVNLFWLFDKKGNIENILIKVILCTQLASFIVNFLLHFHKKLKIERYLSLLAIFLWFAANYYLEEKLKKGTLHEVNYEVIEGRGVTHMSIYSTSMLVAGIIISIWYFTICVREIQYLMKKKRKR